MQSWIIGSGLMTSDELYHLRRPAERGKAISAEISVEAGAPELSPHAGAALALTRPASAWHEMKQNVEGAGHESDRAARVADLADIVE